jgi:predicted nucleotide-binding protein
MKSPKRGSSSNIEERDLAKVNAGITKLQQRLEEFKAISQDTSIDYNKLESITKHFIRNVGEIFGAGSTEFEQQKDSMGVYHPPFYDTSWTELQAERQLQSAYRAGINRLVPQIDSLVLQLEEEKQIYSQPSLSQGAISSQAATGGASKPNVFIVHGQDTEFLREVERLVVKLDASPIILSDKPSMGATILEKFEREGSPVDFALVLLSPDDIGAPAPRHGSSQIEWKARARQNVILELGYFIGKLGRGKVAVLYKGKDLELPSDIHGLVYIPMNGSWELAVAKEMRAAKLPIDLNRLAD